MKPILAGFAAMALLVVLEIAPPAEALRGPPSEIDRKFAERHSGEPTNALRAELGLEAK
jgi:hypothetical protein